MDLQGSHRLAGVGRIVDGVSEQTHNGVDESLNLRSGPRDGAQHACHRGHVNLNYQDGCAYCAYMLNLKKLKRDSPGLGP